MSPPSYAFVVGGCKNAAVFAWLAQVERTKQAGLYLLLFVEVDLLKHLKFLSLEKLQTGRVRILQDPTVPLVKESYSIEGGEKITQSVRTVLGTHQETF